MENLVEELFRPHKDGDIPYLYAKKRMPIQHTYDLFDKSWEGLKKVNRNGKIVFEPCESYNVVIDGATGECRIPDTKKNRARLEMLCKPHKVDATHMEIQPDGTFKEVKTTIEAPSQFTRLDENLIETRALDSMEAKLLDRISKKFDLIPKEPEEDDVPEGLGDDEKDLLKPV